MIFGLGIILLAASTPKKTGPLRFSESTCAIDEWCESRNQWFVDLDETDDDGDRITILASTGNVQVLEELPASVEAPEQ